MNNQRDQIKNKWYNIVRVCLLSWNLNKRAILNWNYSEFFEGNYSNIVSVPSSDAKGSSSEFEIAVFLMVFDQTGGQLFKKLPFSIENIVLKVNQQEFLSEFLQWECLALPLIIRKGKDILKNLKSFASHQVFWTLQDPIVVIVDRRFLLNIQLVFPKIATFPQKM